jgi:hypothetical protein
LTRRCPVPVADRKLCPALTDPKLSVLGAVHAADLGAAAVLAGTLRFAAGETSKQIVVPIAGDTGAAIALDDAGIVDAQMPRAGRRQEALPRIDRSEAVVAAPATWSSP